MIYNFIYLQISNKKNWVLIFMLFISSLVHANLSTKDSIVITIFDQINNTPIHQVRVLIKKNKYLTDENGMVIIPRKHHETEHAFLHAFGYKDTMVKIVHLDKSIVYLKPIIYSNEEVVISATKKKEKITEVPALIDLISNKQIEISAAPSLTNIYSTLLGVEYLRTSVNNYALNARGFNNALNGKFLIFIDGRNASFPGVIGIPMNNYAPLVKEDIDKIEVLVGPNSALYGPNAHSGVQSIISKDPFKYSGLTAAVTVGSQNTYSARIRWAQKINSKLAYKLVTEYTATTNFKFNDSLYYGGLTTPYGIPVAAALERYVNDQFTTFKFEGYFYWKIKPSLNLIFNSGYALNSYIFPANTGRIQETASDNMYAQLRIVGTYDYFQFNVTSLNLKALNLTIATRDYYNRLNSNITNTSNPLFNNFGRLNSIDADIFAKRLGNTFVDNASRYIAEYQRIFRVPLRDISIISNLYFQLDKPNSMGTLIYDSVIPYTNTQLGWGIQFEKKWHNKLTLILAGRLDYHDKFGVFASPKILFSYPVTPNSHLRLSYSVANSTPLIVFQNTHFTGSLFGSINGLTYIPNGANVNNPASLVNFPKIQVESLQTIEFGYKGLVAKKLFIDADVYVSNSRNFLSPAIAVLGRIVKFGEINIPTSSLANPGTVDSTGRLSNAGFSTFFNYGNVISYGLDLGLKYTFNERISTFLKYSYFNSDLTEDNLKNDANRDGYVSLEERSLNVPNHRISWQMTYHSFIFKKLSVELGARWLPPYDYYSGSQIASSNGVGQRGVVYGGINPLTNQPRYYYKFFNNGPLGGFTTFDISFLYKLNIHTQFNLSITNVFNTLQYENISVPSIGRLIFLEIKKTF